MSNTEIKKLLARLHDEIVDTDIDDDTRALVRQLGDELQTLIDNPADDAGAESVRKTTQSLEANFATKHPTAERFLREFIDALGKMGI